MKLKKILNQVKINESKNIMLGVYRGLNDEDEKFVEKFAEDFLRQKKKELIEKDIDERRHNSIIKNGLSSYLSSLNVPLFPDKIEEIRSEIIKQIKQTNMSSNANLSATGLEDWFEDNTNLQKNTEDKGIIKIKHETSEAMSLADFLKKEIHDLFLLEFDLKGKNEISAEASLKDKFDLFLKKDNKIILNNDSSRSRSISTDYKGESFKSEPKFEMKKMSKTNLIGHFLTQLATVSNYNKAIDIAYGHGLRFGNIGIEELKKIIGNKSTHHGKEQMREEFREFLRSRRNTLTENIRMHLTRDTPELNFFDNLADFLNKYKNNKEIFKIPANLYLFQVNDKISNDADLRAKFEELNKGIINLDENRGLLRFERGQSRIEPFEHIEIQFTNKPSSFYNIDMQSESVALKNRMRILSEEGHGYIQGRREHKKLTEDNLYINIKIKSYFSIETIIGQTK